MGQGLWQIHLLLDIYIADDAMPVGIDGTPVRVLNCVPIGKEEEEPPVGVGEPLDNKGLLGRVPAYKCLSRWRDSCFKRSSQTLWPSTGSRLIMDHA